METKKSQTKKYFAVLTTTIIIIAGLIGLFEKVGNGDCGYFLEQCQDEIQKIEDGVEILEQDLTEFE